MSDRIKLVMEAVERELRSATARHGSFHSTHEGLGVLTEEYFELVEALRTNDPRQIKAEAVQVAAMAARMLLDCSIDCDQCAGESE